MNRVRAVSRHIIASANAGNSGLQQNSVFPDEDVTDAAEETKSPSLTPDDMRRIFSTFEAYKSSIDRLYKNGEMPEMSMFDVFLAAKNQQLIGQFEDVAKLIEKGEETGELEILRCLPGPWQDAKTIAEKEALVRDNAVTFNKGYDIFASAKWQVQYGDKGLGSNIIIPYILGRGTGTERKMNVGHRVIIGNPVDAERLSRTHVRKEDNFKGILFESIISTQDNEHWRAQRKHLVEAFLPLSSLAQIFPTSLNRAKTCAHRLAESSVNGDKVDMSDFLLHEAQAQLQLALLGASESMMEATNKDVRNAFAGDVEKGKIGALGEAMKSLMNMALSDTSLALPADGTGAVRGPLSRAVQTSGVGMESNYGNMLLILFAGHDTTGHTMTWLLFELARHPEHFQKLHAEVDTFFAELNGRDPEYRDLARLEFMDRCITETLRMWPAVANGTYRELQFDDHVTGPGGNEVTLPKGTHVQLVNWSRHRNPDLWGKDVDEWNPNREFKDGELASVGCPMAAANIQSDRFSPFAHNPRSCLGRNFAQMEMRLIMLYLLRTYTFSLAPPYDRLIGTTQSGVPEVGEFRGINRGTMAPMDLEFKREEWWGRRYQYALGMHVRPRLNVN